MTHGEIRDKFLKFFESRGHKIVPSSSLLPTDPSVLFTTAGMQQFKDYYTGKADAIKDFGLLNTVSIQKSMRTSDIDEVGDETHLTFFEMLGNFSFGGYWKKEAIEWAHEFVTKELELKIDYVSIFGGEGQIPADEESEQIWKSVDPKITVKRFGREDNFWGPTGSEGPCGPTTEIYVGGVEIWNIVFNEYYLPMVSHAMGEYESYDEFEKRIEEEKWSQLSKLKKQGIDTGMGLERLAMVVQKKNNIFETDLFESIIRELPTAWTDIKVKRILADHSRTICFLIADGVRPSNKEQGYVLRKLVRRSIVHAQDKQSTSFQGIDTLPMGVDTDLKKLFSVVIRNYNNIYPNLDENAIFAVFNDERKKFGSAFRTGLRELKKLPVIDAKSAFKLYESYGFPYESIKEFGGERAVLLTRENFDEEFKKHQEISRAGAEKKFGGHGLLMDTGDLKSLRSDLKEEELKKATRLHTATHLLHASLRKVLSTEVHQAGSDITAERLRFDFTFPRKLAPEEIKQVEDMVNEAVQKDYPVTKEEMSYEDAIKSGAMAFFKLKYPPRVNVYSVGDFSKELCGGPHVSHTAEIGKFKIVKEEAVSAGVRRIRAVVE